MYVTIANLVLTRTFVRKILADLQTGASTVGVADALVAEFFNVNVTPDPSAAIGDVSASLSAIGDATLAMTGPVNLPDGRIGWQSPLEVIAGVGPDPETLYGVCLTDVAGDLAGFGMFNVPVEIAVAGDFVSTDIVLALPTTLPTGV